MIKNLCVITDRYPTREYPMNTFLDQLVCGFADRGVRVTVVAPYCPILDRLKGNCYHPLADSTRVTEQGATFRLICPKIPALIGRKIAGLNFAKLYQHMFESAVLRTVAATGEEFDAYYGHFITPAGFAAIKTGTRRQKPSFCAYGEASLTQDSCNFSLQEIRERLSGISGVVAVSSQNRDTLLENELVPPEKIGVFPNAVNAQIFRVMDKALARKRLGIGPEDFVVAFVGHFIARKGSARVSAALQKLGNVRSIFVGAGPETPKCEGIVYCGKLAHDEIPEYLNAADVFVLPTLAEGCCNAVVEAMACGLPVISSNLPFNDDILDDTNAIRLDPMDVDAIAAAIARLRDDVAFRARLARGATAKAETLRIGTRAQNILAFLEERAK